VELAKRLTSVTVCD